jgi:hypothetical protein
MPLKDTKKKMGSVGSQLESLVLRRQRSKGSWFKDSLGKEKKKRTPSQPINAGRGSMHLSFQLCGKHKKKDQNPASSRHKYVILFEK